MNMVYLGNYYVKGFGPIALYTNEYYDGAGVYYGLWRSAGLSGYSKLVGNDAKFSEEDLNREDVPGYVGDYVRARLREAGYGRTTESGKAMSAAERKRKQMGHSLPVITLTDSPDIVGYLEGKDKARIVKAALREYMEKHNKEEGEG